MFDALRDPRFFASCIDGVGELAPLGGERYDAMLETKVAYIQLKFKVVVEMTRIDPPQRSKQSEACRSAAWGGSQRRR